MKKAPVPYSLVTSLRPGEKLKPRLSPAGRSYLYYTDTETTETRNKPQLHMR